jgi:hypothetical protein
MNSVNLQCDSKYLVSFSVNATAKGIIEILYLKGSPPWTKYFSKKIGLLTGERNYSLLLTPKKFEQDDTQKKSIRFCIGKLPKGKYNFSNISITKIQSIKEK